MNSVSVEHAAASTIAGMMASGTRSTASPPPPSSGGGEGGKPFKTKLLKKKEQKQKDPIKEEERLVPEAGKEDNTAVLKATKLQKTKTTTMTTKNSVAKDVVDEQEDEDPLYVTKLRPSDVLLGRGTGPNNHPGNIDFRLAVEELKRGYVSTASRKAKKRLVLNAVRSVQKEKKGRFLSKLSKSELKRLKLSQPERYELLLSRAMTMAPAVTSTENEGCDTAAAKTAGDASGGVIPFYQIVPDEVAMEKTKQALRYVCYKRDARSGSPSSQQLREEDEDDDDDDEEGSQLNKKLPKVSSTPKKASSSATKNKKTTMDKKRKTPPSYLSSQSAALPVAAATTEADDNGSLQSSSCASNTNKRSTNSIGSFLAQSRLQQQEQNKRFCQDALFKTTTASQGGSGLFSPTTGGVPRGLLLGQLGHNDLGLSSPLLPGIGSSLPGWATDAATSAAAVAAGYSQQQILDRADRLIASALSNTTGSTGGSSASSFPHHSFQFSNTSSLLGGSGNPYGSNAFSSLEQELLLTEALRRQVEDQRLFALQQHYMG